MDNIQLGDGVRFKERGVIQITGRAIYPAHSAAFGLQMIALPAQLSELESTSAID